MSIRVTLEILPKGDESRRFIAGTLEIENDTTGTAEVGNYDLKLRGPVQDKQGIAQMNGHWVGGRLEGFVRKRGWWSCVKDALHRLDTDYDE